MPNDARDSYAELEELRTWAATVRDRLARLAGSASPVAQAEFTKAVRLADELHERAGEPISIGLVGEYSVGKSRLLNALLELPGLLPVSGSPTTGNITALRIRATRPGQRPGPRKAAVSYMSRPDLSRVAGFMLSELKSVINRDRLQYDVSSLQGYDPLRDGWEKLEDLAFGWWEREEGANQEVLLYTWELLRLRNAMLTGDEMIPGRGSGWPIQVDLDLIREAIVIGDSRALPDRFPERPRRRPIRPGAALTAADLRDTLPLVRRLTYDVDIDPGLLQLSGLRDSNGLELLDFAGLHTSGAARDEYLCGRELERITGYLEVVKADHAETRTATRFATMLEGRRRSKKRLADSAMLVANMFDLVPPTPPGATLAELAANSQELGSLLRIARGIDPRLRRLGLTSATANHGDPHWVAVADALRDGDLASPEANLAKALHAYAADGGITRLRDMLSEHVTTVALPIIVDELTALRTELQDTLARLRRLLAPAQSAVDGESDRKLLAGLVVALNRMVIDVKAAAISFRDAQDIKVAASDERPPGDPAGLLDRIREDAVLSVYPWPVWNVLLSAFHDGQILTPAAAVGSDAKTAADEFSDLLIREDEEDDEDRRWRDDDEDDEHLDLFDRWRDGERRAGTSGRDATSATFPLTTADLKEPFDIALSDLRVSARDLAHNVVTEWVNVLHERHAGLLAQMADPRTRSLLAERLAALYREKGAVRLDQLDAIADLSWIPGLFSRSLARIEKRAEQAGANAYPLAPNHALPWHPDYDKDTTEQDSELRRHHSRVHRLRHDLAEGLAFPVQAAIGMAFGSLDAELGERLDWLEGRVPNQATVLDTPTAPRQEDAGPGPDVALLDELLGDRSHETGETSEETP